MMAGGGLARASWSRSSMGWAHCGTDRQGREIGYSIPAVCDKEGCEQEIDRGLAYACGGMHGEGEFECEQYFCFKHLVYVVDPKRWKMSPQMCESCAGFYEEAE